MKTILRYIYLSLGLSIFLIKSAASLFAQTTETEPTVNIRFRVVTWEANKPGAFTYYNGPSAIEAKGLYPSLRSGFYDYSGPATLVLYTQATPVSGNVTAQSQAKPLASVTIPQGIRYPLLLIAPNPDPGLPYRVLVLADDPEQFPFGSYIFFNMTPDRMAASMGKTQFVIESGRQQLISTDEKAYHIRLGRPKPSAAGWDIVYDDFFPNWKSRRTVVFMIQLPGDGTPKLGLRTLSENQKVWDDTVAKKQ